MTLEPYIDKILLGDCLDILKKIPDKSIDLVLTDPPYDRWIDVPKEYGYYKAVYNRFVRWSGHGFESLKTQSDDILMIDSTHLKAHRTACSLCKKGLRIERLDEQKAD